MGGVYVVTVMRSFLAALLVCALAPSADAKCAMWGLEARVLTKDGATIAPDGGFLVGAMDAEDGETRKGDAAAQSGWRLKLGARAATPTLVTLAPGLVLYKVPADATDAQLIDDKRAIVGKLTVGPRTAPLAAPKIKQVTHDGAQGRRPYAKVNVELAGAAPAGAVALVLADVNGKARSWGLVEPGTTVRALDRGRCRVLANGTIESRPGDRVTAHWVDASGRMSPPSAAIAVVAARPAAPEED